MVLLVYRYGSWTLRLPHARRRPFELPYIVANLVLVRTLAGVDLPRQATVGPGLRLFHGGRGLSVHKNAVIGARVTLFQDVTIGQRSGRDSRAPVIGDDVLIWPHAIVAGGIFVGRGAEIGAHALVLDDVPPGAAALAPRATIRSRDHDASTDGWADRPSGSPVISSLGAPRRR